MGLSDLFSLADRRVLLTGGSGGIGRVFALALAQAGASVGVHGRDRERLDATCVAVEKVGGTAVPLESDLTEVANCRLLVAEACKVLGGLDVLINGAATNRRKPIAEVTEDDYDHVMAVNLRSVYFLSQAAHKIMKEQGGGKIIHIGSANVFYGLDTVSIYGVSKGGMAQLTKAMAVEWADDNVQVNCLTPGFMLTPLSEPLWADDAKARWFRKRIPVRRPGDPEELVGALLMLASRASSYITGQNIVIDGGFLAGGSWLKDETWPGDPLEG